MATFAPATLDVDDLRSKVQDMYHKVAHEPDATFHFAMGRALAERLGYAAADLDRIPAASIESFAGVGYYFDLARLQSGEVVLDLGSGAGMDSFIAALRVGPTGQVIGLDMTDAQLEKAERLRRAAGFEHVSFRKGYLEALPVDDACVDVVISNGVINLCPDKAQVFREIGRVLRPGGRLAIADIVTEKEFPEGITCNATLWAACIGGALQQDRYRDAIEAAGMRIVSMRPHPEYEFLSKSARGTSQVYGVKSISLLAEKVG
jgi:arsenite methyltransferase